MNAFFLPYQKRWIEDDAQIKIMEKSRQIGLSWASAYRAVRECLRRPKTFLWICSQNLVQAQLFLNDCKNFAYIIQQALPVISKVGSQHTYALSLFNKSTLQIVSSNPNAQAGKRGTRILDEFALHEDPEQLYNIAYPGITWGGHLEIISTHRGHNNFFNRLIQEVKHNGNPKKISLHTVTLEDALEQGFLEKLKAKLPANDPRYHMDESAYFDFIRNACASELIFQQEYMCVPMDENTTFIDFRDLQNCFYAPSEAWQHCQNHPTFLGVDLARSRDLSVFVVLEAMGDQLLTRNVQVLQNARFDQQEVLLDQLFNTYHIDRACIDQTGIGHQFVERAQTRWGHAIHGVTFTVKTKEQLAYGLKMLLERGQIKLPKQADLIDDFLAVQLRCLSSHSSFEAKQSSAGHADRFWAFALAVYASRLTTPSTCTTEIFRTAQHFIYED